MTVSAEFLDIFDVSKFEKDYKVKFDNHNNYIEYFLNKIKKESQVKYIKNFDCEFYSQCYPDINKNNKDSLEHYLLHGIYEGRFYSKEHFESSLKKLITKGIISKKTEKDNIFKVVKATHEEINNKIDNQFLYKNYPLAINENINILALITKFNCKYLCLDDINEDIISTINNSSFFNFEYYIKKNSLNDKIKNKNDAIIHYLCEGYKYLFSTSEIFSTKRYYSTSRDLINADINPLYHYIKYGSKEGRIAHTKNTIIDGSLDFDSKKETILIVSHEASRTGAPIVGLELSKTLQKKYNILTWVGINGPLTNEFKDNCSLYIEEQLLLDSHDETISWLKESYSIKYAILNSAETYPVLYECCEKKIKTISLIHEFSEYARPYGRIATMSLLSDHVIVPAKIIKDSIIEDLKNIGLDEQSVNISVRHQGSKENTKDGQIISKRIKSEIHSLMYKRNKKKVVLGCGWVQPRKGVMKFLETANRVCKKRNDVLFIWVGANYNVENDPNYSAYLSDYINRSGIESHTLFIDQLASLEPVWEVADVFFMSSLLDPFPNVAIDAIKRDIPVVCFSKATGIAELSKDIPELVLTAEYLDDHDASIIILDQLEKTVSHNYDIQSILSYEKYCEFIDNLPTKNQNTSTNTNYIDFKIPQWYLNRLNIKHIFFNNEKHVTEKLICNKIKDKTVNNNISYKKLDMPQNGFNPELIIKYHGGINKINELLDFIHRTRAKNLINRVYIISDIINPIYNKISELDSKVFFEIIPNTEYDEILTMISKRTNRWDYQFLIVELDEFTVESTLDKIEDLSRYNSAFINTDKIVLNDGMGNFLFKSKTFDTSYTPSVTYITNDYIEKLLSTKQ